MRSGITRRSSNGYAPYAKAASNLFAMRDSELLRALPGPGADGRRGLAWCLRARLRTREEKGDWPGCRPIRHFIETRDWPHLSQPSAEWLLLLRVLVRLRKHGMAENNKNSPPPPGEKEAVYKPSFRRNRSTKLGAGMRQTAGQGGICNAARAGRRGTSPTLRGA